MADRDLLLQLVIKAVDLATADLEEVNNKVKELGRSLTQSGFTTAGDDMRSFGKAVEAATDPLAQATAKTLAFQTAIAGLASILANKAYQASKDYESALADLAKVIEGGMDAAKGYGARLNETATQFARNGQELVAAMANFVQAGYDAEEAFNLVTESTKLMVAGELDAARSSELLTSILKGFKAPASEAGAAVDLLNDVSNKYATNVEQLAIGMAGLSPIAKQMGFSMAETAGLLTPIIEVYRSGSEAADALKTSLQQLSANTAPVKAALASIGVSQTDLNGKLRDGKDIFLDVARAFLTLSDAQKAYFAQELVGIEQAGRFGQTINSLGQYLKIAADDTDRAGSAMREVAARLDTAEAAARKADESFRQLAVSLGNAFKPQIRGVVEATGELAAAFDRSIKAGDLSPLLNVIKPQIAAIENLFRAMADNLEEALSGVDWRPLVDGLKAVSGELGDAFGKLTEGMDLTTLDGLRNLLQALINLLGNFSQFVAGAVDGLEPLFGALNTLFAAISQNSPALANLAGEIAGLATSANQIVPVVSAFGSAIFGAIGNVAELALKIGLLIAAMKLLSAAGIPVLGILGRLAGAFLALNPAVATAAAALAGFPGLVTAMVAGVGALGYGIGTLINRFVEWASGGQSVGSMLADLVDAITGVNDEITRGATEEEMAIARAKRLAAEKEAQAKATEAAAKAEEEARKKSDANLKAQEDKLKLAAAEEETAKRLEAQYERLGLVYDRLTGQIRRQGEASAKQLQDTRELGDALDKLGVKANFMSDRITAAGAETIATFRGITQNAQATAVQIKAAFEAAISSAETEAEVKQILAAYKEWAEGAKKGSADVAGATIIADKAIKDLKKSTEETTLASRLYAAAGVDALEIKRLEALAAGDLATALKIEEQQRKAAAAAAREQAEASEDSANAAQDNAEAIKQGGDAAETAGNQAEKGNTQITLFSKSWWDLSAAADAYYETVRKNASISGNLYQLADVLAKLADGYDVVAKQEQAAAIAANKLQTVWQQIQNQGFANSAQTLELRNLVAETERAASAANTYGFSVTQAGEDALAVLREVKNEWADLADTIAERNADLRAQLAQLQGRQDESELIRLQAQYTRDLTEAEQQLAQARASGNAEAIALAQRNLQLLREINDEQERAVRQQSRSRSQNSTTVSTSDKGGASGITVNVNASNARLLDNKFVEDLARKLIPALGGIQRRLA